MQLLMPLPGDDPTQVSQQMIEAEGASFMDLMAQVGAEGVPRGTAR